MSKMNWRALRMRGLGFFMIAGPVYAACAVGMGGFLRGAILFGALCGVAVAAVSVIVGFYFLHTGDE